MGIKKGGKALIGECGIGFILSLFGSQWLDIYLFSIKHDKFWLDFISNAVDEY